MKPDLSICIINHKTPELTLACLRSIVQQAEDLSIEVLLVNNTSDNRMELEAAVQAIPQGRFIQNEYPLSFAPNQNLLLRQASGRHVMSLNSDTQIMPGALLELVQFLDRHPASGVVGPKLIHPDGSLQPSCRNFPAFWTHFLEASGLWQLLRNRWSIGRHYYICSPHDRQVEVDWLSGACLLVRREVIKQTGGYDDISFDEMYGEDIDWCRRIQQAGWGIWFDPAAVVVHVESASPMPGRTVQMYRGVYRYCALHLAKPQQVAFRFATWMALVPRWLLARDVEKRAMYRQLLALPIR